MKIGKALAGENPWPVASGPPRLMQVNQIFKGRFKTIRSFNGANLAAKASKSLAILADAAAKITAGLLHHSFPGLPQRQINRQCFAYRFNFYPVPFTKFF